MSSEGDLSKLFSLGQFLVSRQDDRMRCSLCHLTGDTTLFMMRAVVGRIVVSVCILVHRHYTVLYCTVLYFTVLYYSLFCALFILVLQVVYSALLLGEVVSLPGSSRGYGAWISLDLHLIHISSMMWELLFLQYILPE